MGGTSMANVTVQGVSDAWYEFDVTSYLQQQKTAGATQVSFGLKNPHQSVPFVHFNAEEATSGDPELVLTSPPQTLVVSANAVSVNEGGSNAFTVALGAQPSADVTVSVTKQAGGDADL